MQCNSTQTHRRLRLMVQSYSPGGGMCPHVRAQWRHLANTIELVHPTALSSPKPTRQMYRFRRFCRAHGRKSLCFTMGATIPQNCPLPWGDLDLHLIHGSFGPPESSMQTASRSLQRFLHAELLTSVTNRRTDRQTTLLGR